MSAVAVDDCGDEAPWITMVHGMSQDHRVFEAQVEAYRDHYNLLLVDLPGHGLSAAVQGPYGHMEFTQHLIGVIRRHGVDRTHYWGTHTGATVGLLLADAEPALIQSLTLEGPVVPGQNPPVVKTLMSAARDAMKEHGIEAARQLWWSESCWFEHMRTNPLTYRADEHRNIVESFAGAPWVDDAAPKPVEDIEARLARITIPVLIYNGANDHTEFLEASKTIAELIPHAVRVLIPDAGGFPAWEQPDIVNATVSSHLSAAQVA